MESLLRNLNYAVRAPRRSPGGVLVIVISLAAIALVVSWLPACRLLRIDRLAALRAE